MPDWSKELTKPNYSYNELTDLPIIPTKTSQLINDSGFLTEITNQNVTNALGFTPLNAALMGVSEGIATLDENGIIPSSQLPAYVDTILEYNNLSNFPSIGESGKIYVALDTNKSYRWSGTQYIEINSSIRLGEVRGTAYEGHKGKANAIAINNLQYEIVNKQNNLIDVPEISEIRPTDYIYIERNQTIYKILASKFGKFTPDESDPNAIETNDGNIITDENGNEIIIDNNSDSDSNAVETNNGDIILDENGNEIIIDNNSNIDPNAVETTDGNVILDENGNEIIINTNITDTVVTNDGKIILTEDQRELNLG